MKHLGRTGRALLTGGYGPPLRVVNISPLQFRGRTRQLGA